MIYPSEETATALALEAASEAILFTPFPTAPPTGSGDVTLVVGTATPTATLQPTPTPTEVQKTATEKPPLLYYTLSGDTIDAVANRFGVSPDEITSPDYNDIPSSVLLNPDKLLIIPDRLEQTGPSDHIMPDSEITYSASAIDFDISPFVADAGGYLRTYREYRTDGWYNGAEVINRVAYENSVNPRLLLALVEFQSNWLYGEPSNLAETDYPIGWNDFKFKDLYKQLTWAVEQLSIGYYGWRAGTLTEITFPDETTLRLAPTLNAGSVAMQYLFSRLYDEREWGGILYSPDGFTALYETMFGNPWMRAQSVEPLFPHDISQPELELPFEEGKTWNLTGGPHAVWGKYGVLAALDFAPPTDEPGCISSFEWVTAAASGLVIRSYNGIVLIDLDGDGYEQTGWSLFYLHIYHTDRVPAGAWVNKGDPLGHPSCEGGVATGTHVHIARKYNGEWIPADGPLPFVLSGWQTHNGDAPYEGTLTKGNQVVTAHVYGSYDTVITR